jgi:hypothetical protein
MTISVSEATPPTYRFTADGATTIPAIKVNDVVSLAPPRNHQAISGAPNQPDNLFTTPANQLEPMCVKFEAAGSYPFYCVHGETATLVVK